jgi:hypothetical protein
MEWNGTGTRDGSVDGNSVEVVETAHVWLTTRRTQFLCLQLLVYSAERGFWFTQRVSAVSDVVLVLLSESTATSPPSHPVLSKEATWRSSFIRSTSG